MNLVKAHPRLALVTLCALFLGAWALTAAPALAQTSEAPPAPPSVGDEASPAAGGCCGGQGCAEASCACCNDDGAVGCPGGGCGRGAAAQGRGMGGHGCMMGGMGTRGSMGPMGPMGRMGRGARGDLPPAGPGGRGMGPGAGMGAGQPALMHTAMSLVHQRQNIQRTVEEIPGGVRTRTVVKSEDPALAATLVEHVEGMAGLLERGGRVRDWDPLFSELFDHAAAITLDVEQIPGGVLVVETSEDPEVAKLIRAHATKVNEFLARGHGAVHESTPIPEDYHRPGAPQTPE